MRWTPGAFSWPRSIEAIAKLPLQSANAKHVARAGQPRLSELHRCNGPLSWMRGIVSLRRTEPPHSNFGVIHIHVQCLGSFGQCGGESTTSINVFVSRIVYIAAASTQDDIS